MSTSQSAEKAEAQTPAPKQRTPAARPAKVPALVLTQGGAPESWHVIDGVGYVHPTIPSPVGGDREPSLEVARSLDRQAGCSVRLVQVTEAEAKRGREARAKARGEGLAAARQVRRAGRGAMRQEAEQAITEATAATVGKGA